MYASLAAGTSLNISDNIAAHENHIECYRLATDSEKQKMIKALKKSENPKAKEYLKRFFGIKEEPKYDFKPFDKVLVRKEGNKKWNISLFAREIVDDYNGLPYKYECSNGTLWDYCIHFEGNEHLLGTDENPEKMKTITYEGVQHGDWVRCALCGAQMLLPCGADKCPECGENGTLRWVDEERQEIDAKGLDCLDYVRELRVDDYLSPTTLEEIAEEIKKKVNRG